MPNFPLRPNQTQLKSMPPKQALLTMRVIWGALLLGQLFFLGVLVLMIALGRFPLHPNPILALVDAFMLVTIVPVTFLIRQQLFRRARANGVLSSTVYGTGNIIFWAGCEGVSFFGMVVAIITGSLWPTILIVAVAMTMQILAVPKLAAIKAPEETFKIE